MTAFDVPNIGTASPTGTSAQARVNVIGAPILRSANLQSTGRKNAVVTADAAAHDAEKIEYWYVIVRSNQALPACFEGGTLTDKRRLDLEVPSPSRKYHAKVCARSDYGVSETATGVTYIGDAIPAPKVSYTVKTTPEVNGSDYSYRGEAPVIEKDPESTLVFNNTGGSELLLDPQDDGREILVRQCIEGDCSADATVGWSGAPRPVLVKVPPAQDSGQCIDSKVISGGSDALKGLFQISNAAAASAQVTIDGSVQGGLATLKLNWTGRFSGLDPITTIVCVTQATQDPDPQPSPNP